MRWVGPAIALAATLLFLALTVINEGWSQFWLGALAFLAGVETFTLIRPQKDDTFTEAVRKNTRPVWALVILAFFLAWLFFHFVIESRW